MTRRFDPDRPVPGQVLAETLDHAVRAPSAGFSQGWDFVVLTEADDRLRFWSATAVDPVAETTVDPTAGATADPGRPDGWLRGVSAAPVLVVCCADPGAYLERYAEPDKGWTDRDPKRWPIPYWDVDVGMAALLMLLTAVDHDLGALFFGVPGDRHESVRSAFGIPGDRRLVGVVALGYPLGDRRDHPRNPSLARGRRTGVIHRGRFAKNET